ncbi:MAG: Crp/Fnr family transcriptional regulator [Leptolyngbya sp.]|nr:MAG: Crp/Fnr family transcriptional regulator [Leptolyngbya sp.]
MTAILQPPSLYGTANELRFEPRAILPYKLNCLWQVEKGVVRSATWLEDGTMITLGVWGAGDIVGKPLSTIDPYQIECLTKVEASLLSGDRWMQNTHDLLSHIRQSEAFLLIRSYRKIDVMLLKFLAWTARKFGRTVETGLLLDVRLTHQDIAEILNTTRVTITRTLSQLEQQGLIQRLPLHRIVVKNEDLWHYEI